MARAFGLAAALVLSLMAFPAVGAPRAEREDIVGRLRIVEVGPDDIVLDIARANNLGLLEVLAANPGLDPWMPQEKGRILLPKAHVLPDAPRSGLVINLGDLRAYYFRAGRVVFTAPIGIGREGFDTPLGKTRIVRKAKSPTWYPTDTVRKENPGLPRSIPPGPNNPLGSHALYLGWPSFVLHGTNKPDGVGRRVSHGCVRFYPEAIAWLFENVPVGTAVTVVREPVKIGWHEGELFLEAHPEPTQLESLELYYDFEPEPFDVLMERIEAFASDRAAELDRTTTMIVLMRRTGIPLQITNTDSHPVSIFEPEGSSLSQPPG